MPTNKKHRRLNNIIVRILKTQVLHNWSKQPETYFRQPPALLHRPSSLHQIFTQLLLKGYSFFILLLAYAASRPPSNSRVRMTFQVCKDETSASFTPHAVSCPLGFQAFRCLPMKYIPNIYIIACNMVLNKINSALKSTYYNMFSFSHAHIYRLKVCNNILLHTI